MKEVTHIEDFKQLESDYMNNQTKFLIEDKILYSFEKKDLEKFISSTEKDYLKEVLPYKHQIAKVTKKQGLNEIEQYFIEQIYFFFSWWYEMNKTKEFIERLKRFYKLNHTDFLKNKEFKKIDINTILITEIISMYTKLPWSLSRNMKCPLHNDTSPSFHIYEQTNSFYCFGCHKWWNSVNFVAEIENITTKEAFKKIVKLYS